MVDRGFIGIFFFKDHVKARQESGMYRMFAIRHIVVVSVFTTPSFIAVKITVKTSMVQRNLIKIVRSRLHVYIFIRLVTILK